MKLIVKTFQEITIKSRPVRKRFIRQLAKNIRAVLRDLDPELKVEGEWDNLEVETAVVDAKARREMIERLTCTRASVISSRSTSIRWAISTTSSPSARRISATSWPARPSPCAASAPAARVHLDGGGALRRQRPAPRMRAAGIDLKQPEVEVRMEIRLDRLFVIHRQHPGLGGYPLGALEQVLVLMSGGFDSTVAAYQMMRRG